MLELAISFWFVFIVIFSSNLLHSVMRVRICVWLWVGCLGISIGRIHPLFAYATLLLFQLLLLISCFPLLIYKRRWCTYICRCQIIASFRGTSRVSLLFSYRCLARMLVQSDAFYNNIGNNTIILTTLVTFGLLVRYWGFYRAFQCYQLITANYLTLLFWLS